MDNERAWDVFLELHRDNLREGPGASEFTEKAFRLLPRLPDEPRILDLGCGPGMQTLDLARLSGGRVTALDSHSQYLDQLRAAARRAGMEKRVSPVSGDMSNLDFPGKSFDLIWAEASIYNVGFEKGLGLWKPFLEDGGCLVVSEALWLKSGAPKEVLDFWSEGYPAMQDHAANLEAVERAGYRVLGHFPLPESAWWNYYDPLLAKLPALKEKYKDFPEGLEILAAEEREIELFRNYSEYYGYAFYAMRDERRLAKN